MTAEEIMDIIWKVAEENDLSDILMKEIDYQGGFEWLIKNFDKDNVLGTIIDFID